MKSIRIYLVVAIISTITLTNFVLAIQGYRASMDKAQNLFDKQLTDTASLIASLLNRGPGDNGLRSSTGELVFQVLADAETVINASQRAPEVAMAPLREGFHETNFSGFRWRVFCTYNTLGGNWIMVAERLDLRYEIAERVIMESVVPIVASLPLIGFIIWFIVGHGLKLLRELTRELHSKRDDDLSRLSIVEPPTELAPVIDAVNTLLSRLDASFERERRFSADAAHELRTPISILKVHLHNLSHQFDSRDPTFRRLSEGVSRLGHLVEQILALYQTTPEYYKSHFEPLDLYTVAQATIAEQYSQFEQKRQTVELIGEHCEMAGDRFSLQILFNNLLSNANKYTPEGGCITVEVHKPDDNHKSDDNDEPDNYHKSDNYHKPDDNHNPDRVELIISDTGPGISVSEASRVFERFYRIGGDRHSSSVSGCGLGLSIVKHIADLHHAHITLGKSHGCQGLRVNIEFPATRD